MARRPKHQGRVTPKTRPPQKSTPSNEPKPLGQVGRRPPNPPFLLLLGLMWIVCGIVAFIGLSASWKLIPAIVFVGVGGFFIRGAATAAARRDQ